MLKKSLLLSSALMAVSIGSAFAGNGSQINDGVERYQYYATKATLSRFAGDEASANKSWGKAQTALQEQSDQLDPTAAFKLGQIYETGNDFVPQNFHAAFANYERADKRGHPEAEAKMEEVKNKMTEEQRQGYNSNRPIPALHHEMLSAIMAESELSTLASLAQVSLEIKNLSEDDNVWLPFVQQYEIEEVLGIPLKKRAEAHQHLVEAWVADIEKKEEEKHTHIQRAYELGDPTGFHCILQQLFIDFRENELSQDSIKDISVDVSLLHLLIDDQIEKGNKRGYTYLIKGLGEGMYGYTQDLEACHQLIEDQEKIGNEKVSIYKFSGLYYARYGYEKDQKEACNFGAQCEKKGKPGFVHRVERSDIVHKIKELLSFKLGPGYNRPEAIRLIRKHKLTKDCIT